MIVALVASLVHESFRKNRTLYVPGVAGIVNATAAPVIPAPGLVRVPFRYFQSMYVASARWRPTAPTQSPAFPGPLAIVAVTVPPGTMVVALSATLGGAAAVTVIVALVASLTYESFRKNRTLYVPGVAGIVNGTAAPVIPATGLVRVPFRYFQSM